jgi:putative cardiolipin synthase
MQPSAHRKSLLVWIVCWSFLIAIATSAAAANDASNNSSVVLIDEQIAAHPGQSGAYVLEHGEEALIARAWLADHAEHSIEVQYFIWSTDNIGILAAESVLRAADRGVHVRIIVDDMLVDAPDKSLLALAAHPNIDIRIYNPTKSVGVPLHKEVANAAVDFHGFNQRMHDKTFIVDGKVAITGGRNMSSEYYDYNAEYNFRDRDALLAGDVVKAMGASFESFWQSKLTLPVEDLYGGLGITKKNVRVNADDIQMAYRDLHEYAQHPANFSPEVRAAIDAAPTAIARIAKEAVWCEVDFIHDLPGKNDSHLSLSGGGVTTTALKQLIESAKSEIVIQSPYLILSDEALELFSKTLARGVHIRINTNSLASTDNLPAFGGYLSQRRKLLEMGLEIFEYRPDAQSHRRVHQQELVGHMQPASTKEPIFGLHAKTLVIDGKLVFIGTYNLDPRSQNLNTEVGAAIFSEVVASAVQASIEIDMQPENSWNAADDPDRHVSLLKRTRVLWWRLMPIKPLL